MDMKRMEISRLMDEYTDTEFFPEGGSAVNSAAVKDRVLANAAPAKKRRVPPLKAALLAAALALGAVLCIAAGRAVIYITSPSNTTITLGDDSLHIDQTEHNDYWLVKEDDRFFLDFDGDRTEITGLFDESTPYIHTVTDPSGVTFYYVVGGTPENYGFTEFEVVPGQSRGESMPHNTFIQFDGQGSAILDGQANLLDQDGNLLCPSSLQLSDFDSSYRGYAHGDEYILEWRWYTAACDQLGFQGFYAPRDVPLLSSPVF